jgi:RIP homotypic interaction motif
MDPVTLILTALAAGAVLGVKDTASQAVHDAYNGLKALVKKRFGGRADGELVLARYAEAPETWKGPLAAELTATGAGGDADLVAAAQALLALADPAGSQAGKYTVQVHGGQGVQVGDHNIQHNTFGTAPDR